jgi:hypothetical protein
LRSGSAFAILPDKSSAIQPILWKIGGSRYSFCRIDGASRITTASEESQTFGEAAALSARHHHGEDDDAEDSDRRASESGGGNYGGSTAFIL